MVILRCLTGLTYDWFKSYDTKPKYFHFFVQKQTFASFAFFVILCRFGVREAFQWIPDAILCLFGVLGAKTDPRGPDSTKFSVND